MKKANLPLEVLKVLLPGEAHQGAVAILKEVQEDPGESKRQNAY